MHGYMTEATTIETKLEPDLAYG